MVGSLDSWRVGGLHGWMVGMPRSGTNSRFCAIDFKKKILNGSNDFSRSGGQDD